MDRVVRWVDFENGRSGGDPVHASRLRPTGMVVFATVDALARRRPAAQPPVVLAPVAPARLEPGQWLRRRAARGACWLLGR